MTQAAAQFQRRPALPLESSFLAELQEEAHIALQITDELQ